MIKFLSRLLMLSALLCVVACGPSEAEIRAIQTEALNGKYPAVLIHAWDCHCKSDYDQRSYARLRMMDGTHFQVWDSEAVSIAHNFQPGDTIR